MSGLVQRLNEATASVGAYRQSGDPADLEAASAGIGEVGARAAELRDESDTARETMDSVAGAIASYQAALANYATLDRQNAQRLQDMLARTTELESRAVAIRDAQQAEYSRLVEGLEVAETEQARRLDLAQAADDLIRATLKAREGEAVFRLTRAEADADVAMESIKQMFLAAVALRKLSAGTADEAAVAKVSKEVNAYRKSFADLAKAYEAGEGVSAVEAELAKSSTRINAFTGAIEKRQREAYNEVAAGTAEARKLVDRAVVAQADALRLVAFTRGLQLAEREFVQQGGGEQALEPMQQQLRSIGLLPIKLRKFVDGDDQFALVEQIDQAIKAYRAALEQMAEALDLQAEAEQTMRAAQDAVLGLVRGADQTLGAAMDDQRVLSQTLMVAGTLGALAIGIVLAFVIGRGISRPVSRLTAVMQRLVANDFSVEVPDRERRDELGAMALAVQVFKDNGQEVERLRAEQQEAERRAQAERDKLMLELADTLDVKVKAIVDAVRSASDDMTHNAQSMSKLADQTKEQSAAVRDASAEASQNVQTVAASAEELSSSIAEINRNVASSNEIAKKATEEARRTNEEVEGLVAAAQRIGEVVNLIQDIAEQTNLLALNATIEAARAGEAGKGFAVVASEVKNLATQTGKATEEIAQQITAMQNATTSAASVIGGIGKTIDQMNEIASAILSTVEQQAGATQEIARNVQQACHGTEQVTDSIDSVSEAADKTDRSAASVLQASAGLAEQSVALAEQLEGLVVRLRESASASSKAA
ncbi:MAG: methyl-accepting chemotaxis protein [Kiloniellales bacterium]